MPKLQWRLGETSGEVPLDGPLSFGRSPENGLVLADTNVSGRHALVEPDGSGRWRVVDQGSTNGLVWGGVRKTEIPLVDGTEFSAGDVRFRFVGDVQKAVTTGDVAKTTAMGIPVVATTAMPVPVPVPAAESQPAPLTASVPLPPADAPRPLWKNPLVLAVAAVVVVLSVWLVGRKSSTEPGMPIFASEKQVEVIRLRHDMESPVSSTRWGAYNRLKARGEKVDPVPLWIIDVKTHPDDDTREESAKKLGNRKDPRAIPQLRWSKENDSDWNVRRAAGNALEEMGIK